MSEEIENSSTGAVDGNGGEKYGHRRFVRRYAREPRTSEAPLILPPEENTSTNGKMELAEQTEVRYHRRIQRPQRTMEACETSSPEVSENIETNSNPMLERAEESMRLTVKPQQDETTNQERGNGEGEELVRRHVMNRRTMTNGMNRRQQPNNNNRRGMRLSDSRNEHQNPRIGCCDIREINRLTDFDRVRLEASNRPDIQVIDYNELQASSIEQLTGLAGELGLSEFENYSRHDLLCEIIRAYTRDPQNVIRIHGVLEVMGDGHAFIRNVQNSYTPHIDDVYVNQLLVAKLKMKTGDTVCGQLRQPRENEPFVTLLRVEQINGDSPDVKRHLAPFDKLIPYFPTKRFILERNATEMCTRVIDLVTPIGRGQRGLIVAGPRTGKTVIMQKIANSILENDPDVELIILLIDERPEEVTDMKREVKAEVVSSTFDEPPERHIQVAEIILEKAKRLVEHGKHVVILLDSITRLARAYNTVAPRSGRILTGGVDANALTRPKRFFGAARNIEGGGSLTILATALTDTGSKMDDVIFEEFKGTGNMELHLDSRLVDRRLYPAIDVTASGTRREELLVHKDELPRLWALRRAFSALSSTEAMESLLKHLKKFNTDVEFLLSLKLPEEEQ